MSAVLRIDRHSRAQWERQQENRKGRTPIVLGLLLAACGTARLAGDALSLRPSGNIVTETRAENIFHSVDLRAFGEVEIVQGEPQSLTVEGSDNVVALIVTSV